MGLKDHKDQTNTRTSFASHASETASTKAPPHNSRLEALGRLLWSQRIKDRYRPGATRESKRGSTEDREATVDERR